MLHTPILSPGDTALEALGFDMLSAFWASRARMLEQQAARAAATAAVAAHPSFAVPAGAAAAEDEAAFAQRQRQRLLLTNPARAAWEDSYLAIWSLMTELIGITQQALRLARGGYVVAGGPIASQWVYLEVRACCMRRRRQPRRPNAPPACTLTSPLSSCVCPPHTARSLRAAADGVCHVRPLDTYQLRQHRGHRHPQELGAQARP